MVANKIIKLVEFRVKELGNTYLAWLLLASSMSSTVWWGDAQQYGNQARRLLHQLRRAGLSRAVRLWGGPWEQHPHQHPCSVCQEKGEAYALGSLKDKEHTIWNENQELFWSDCFDFLWPLLQLDPLCLAGSKFATNDIFPFLATIHKLVLLVETVFGSCFYRIWWGIDCMHPMSVF